MGFADEEAMALLPLERWVDANRSEMLASGSFLLLFAAVDCVPLDRALLPICLVELATKRSISSPWLAGRRGC